MPASLYNLRKADAAFADHESAQEQLVSILTNAGQISDRIDQLWNIAGDLVDDETELNLAAADMAVDAQTKAGVALAALAKVAEIYAVAVRDVAGGETLADARTRVLGMIDAQPLQSPNYGRKPGA